MFPKMVGFPPKSSILMGFSILFTIHFGGKSPYFWKHPNQNKGGVFLLDDTCHLKRDKQPNQDF